RRHRGRAPTDHPRTVRPLRLTGTSLHGSHPGQRGVPRPHTRRRGGDTMTASTSENVPTPQAPRRHTVLLHALRSEWTKLWTVRSTYWTLLAAAVIMIGYAALLGGTISSTVDSMSAQERASLPSSLFFSLV